jgi:hypothetical protein
VVEGSMDAAVAAAKALSTCCRPPLSVKYSGHDYLNPYLQEPSVST